MCMYVVCGCARLYFCAYVCTGHHMYIYTCVGLQRFATFQSVVFEYCTHIRTVHVKQEPRFQDSDQYTFLFHLTIDTLYYSIGCL